MAPVSSLDAQTQALARKAAPPSIASAASQTAFCQDGTWSYTRTERCLAGLIVTFTLINQNTGEVLGTAHVRVDQTMTLNRTGPSWNENIAATLLDASTTIPALNLAFTASCQSPCTTSRPNPWVGTWAVTLANPTASGTVTYYDNPAAGTQNNTTLSYRFGVSMTGVPNTLPDPTWSDNGIIRCDFQVGSNPGCIYSQARGVFDVSVSQYGAAAMTYYFAETYLIDGWGMDQPLTRLADDGLAEKNRTSTCGGFIPDYNLVTTDSCDEYPFAKTYQGGTPGALCAEVIPTNTASGWVYYYYTDHPFTGNEKCVTGHVANNDNVNAGLALGRFTQDQRILDSDAYYVNITA